MHRKSQLDIILDKDTFLKGYGENTLCGTMVFTAGSSIKAKKIRLLFEGRYIISTATEIRKRETTFFHNVWVFLDESRGKSFEGGQRTVYDFTLPLPADLPESIKSEFGSIQYKLKASITTNLMHTNIKTEKSLFIQRHADSLLTSRYITTTSQNWRDMISCFISIPSFRFAPGDEFPLTLQHRVTCNSKLVRVLLAACLLKQRIIYKSPTSSSTVVRETEKKLDMTFVWFQEDTGSGEKSMKIKIPSSLKIYDSSNQYIEVTHRLQIRLDVGYEGKLHNAHYELPIIISSQNQDASEELPQYNTIPSPPSYESGLENGVRTSSPIVTFLSQHRSVSAL